MFSHLLRLHGLYPEFGRVILGRQDLIALAQRINNPPSPWCKHVLTLSINETNDFLDTPCTLTVDSKEAHCIIDIDKSLPDDTFLFYLARMIGSFYLHTPEPTRTTTLVDARFCDNLFTLMDKESIYFALCCCIPSDVMDALFLKHSNHANRVNHLVHKHMPNCGYDFTSLPITQTEAAEWRIQGHILFRGVINA
jgi:hypothetical protein